MDTRVAAVAPVATAKPSTVRWKIFLLMLFLISINYIDRASLSVARLFSALYMTRSESIASTPPIAMR